MHCNFCILQFQLISVIICHFLSVPFFKRSQSHILSINSGLIFCLMLLRVKGFTVVSICNSVFPYRASTTSDSTSQHNSARITPCCPNLSCYLYSALQHYLVTLHHQRPGPRFFWQNRNQYVLRGGENWELSSLSLWILPYHFLLCLFIVKPFHRSFY